jgi:hypothetical protein
MRCSPEKSGEHRRFDIELSQDHSKDRKGLGEGQIILGIAATMLAFATLWALKWLDMRLPREHRATLVIRTSPKISVFRMRCDELLASARAIS